MISSAMYTVKANIITKSAKSFSVHWEFSGGTAGYPDILSCDAERIASASSNVKYKVFEKDISID